MSGIYGIYYNSDAKQSKQTIDSILSSISKWNLAYGESVPCHTTFLHAGFGICADHITNAPHNTSPILQKDSYLAVIDAVIYNRSDLIMQYSLSETLSDEELLFTCILSQGFDVLVKVNGDFCGAILNTTNQELVLFRDHMGIRPLFYYHTGSWLGFSSDIRGLIAIPDMPANINPDWLYKNICGYDTAEYIGTEIRDVFFVKPASYLKITTSSSGLSLQEYVYWTLGRKKIRLHSEKAYQEKLRQLITDSIKRRLDVFPDRIGAELSGGLDSGVIDILIHRLGREATYYSWSYSPEDLPLVPGDERHVIADICQQENITCEYGKTSMNLGPDSNLGKSHTKIGLKVDLSKEPRYNYALPLYLNTLIVCETAELMQKSNCKVVFTGHGGDEGVSHRCDPYELYLHKEYWHYFKYLWDNNAIARHRLYSTLKICRRRAKKGKECMKTPFVSYRKAPEMLKKDFADKYINVPMPILTFAFDVIPYIYSGNTHNRPDVTALLGAYSGARYVFPYLDYRVIDYAVSIPRHLYLKENQKRYIFRKAFQDIMPDSLYTCTAKDNPSTANMKDDATDWYERFIKYREFLFESIDRQYWEPYLDFEFLDQWRDSPEPNDEERARYSNILSLLSDCLQFQNMVSLVKSLS